jgi:predicted dehydrogenase
MKRKIRMGMIGGGIGAFIGIAHRIASYIGEEYVLIGGAFDVDYNKGLEFAEGLGLNSDRVYKDIDTFVEKELALPPNERIELVSIVTPNFLHFSMAKKLIEAGFNVVCEKPVTTTSEEALELERLIEKHKVVFCLAHTYTGYPMVRQMKKMIADGVIGDVQKVDAQYYQGWINPVIHTPEKRKTVWRLDPAKAGISSCMGDIGVHAFNMIEYTTGLEVKQLLSDISTLYPDNPLDVDGTVLLRIKDNIRGVVRASQIATGEENNLTIAVYGNKGGFKWEQENPNYLYWITDDKPTQVLKPGHAYNSVFAKDSTKMAPGHPEGIFDAMGNLYRGAAKAIRKESLEVGEFPTINDGVRGMKFIEKVVESSKQGNVWVSI